MEQDKDPTAVTPSGRSLSPAMRGFFEVAQTQSVLQLFNFSAVGTLINHLFSMGSAGSDLYSGEHDGECAIGGGISTKRGMATEAGSHPSMFLKQNHKAELVNPLELPHKPHEHSDRL